MVLTLAEPDVTFPPLKRKEKKKNATIIAMKEKYIGLLDQGSKCQVGSAEGDSK